MINDSIDVVQVVNTFQNLLILTQYAFLGVEVMYCQLGTERKFREMSGMSLISLQIFLST